MTLNYAQALTDFWEEAPDRPGFKHVYAASFCALMHLVQESGKRSIAIKYGPMNGLLKLSEEAYSESLKWLDEAGFIVYFKGKGRHAPATIFVDVPEIAPFNVTDSPILPTGISGGTGGGNGGSTGGGTGVGKQEVAEESPDFLPPYPPIEDNIISPTYLPTGAGRQAGVLIKPKNIVLSLEEETDLVATYGLDVTARMLLLVSAYKREQGGSLKASDFTNCIKWAALRIRQADTLAASLPRPVSTGPTTPATPAGPVSPPPLPRPAHKPFRELT